MGRLLGTEEDGETMSDRDGPLRLGGAPGRIVLAGGEVVTLPIALPGG